MNFKRKGSDEESEPALNLTSLTERSFEFGVRVHRVRGGSVRVYSPAKTVADCFKYRNKIGIDVAVEALKDYTRKHRSGASELARHARARGVSRIMQPYMDAIA